VVESDSDKANAFKDFLEDCSPLPKFSINIDALVLDDVPISPKVVHAKLNKLNPNKAAGPDNWPPKVLKEMVDQLCTPLTILFSKCLNSSTLPTSWKRDHVVSIHKKGV